MVQASDLMIGNLLVTPEGKFEKVDALMLLDLSMAISSKNIGAFIYSPIPLSPEILGKARFKKYDWQDAYFIKTIFGDLYIHFYKGRIITRFVSVSKDNNGHKMVSLGFIGNQKSTEEIKYLHQLQNLVKILTGSELTINL